MANRLCLVNMSIFSYNTFFVLNTFLSLSLTILAETTVSFDECHKLGSFIDCSNKKLTKVPSDLPSWAETLKLNKNVLTEIPYLASATNLTVLCLGHNSISSVSRNALDSMSNLRNLELNNNNIKEIGWNDFPIASKLQTLNLNHNEITRIENGSFNGLKSLEDLRLSRNKLSSFVKDTFKELASLRTLELNKNQLTAISGLTFQGLNLLLTLKLRQNNIEDLSDGAFFGLYHLNELQLDYNDLTTISGGWLYGLELLNHLNVSNNKIHSLPNEWSLCPHLKELDISNNKLESIMKDSFKHLTDLVLLKLNNNRISFIEEAAFKFLPSLQILDLSNNLISWIVENTNGVFVSLKHLQQLYLAGNKISHISRNAFSGLSNLTFLDLSNNPIASIEDKVFSALPSLYELHANSSSMICDCNLAWLAHWLNDTNVLVRPNALTCVYPANLKKKMVHLVTAKDFICLHNDHPQPQITSHPNETTALVGNNVTLRCGANSSIDSDMTFSWKMNNHRMENVATKRYESAQNHGVTQFSELFLSSVTMQNNGMYQCIVANSYGIAYSKYAQLSVLVFPTIEKPPVNVMAKVGAAAKLQCAASGYPTPKILWHKDDRSGFPAARERRMKIMNISPDEPSFIVDVKLEDAGVYTCTAQNAAGSVNASATLTVLEPPSFSKSMKNKQVQCGESAVLECLAEGSHKPKISWTKNDKPVTSSKRYILAAEDQLLVIVDTVLDDSGVYECKLSNEWGAQHGRSELKVVAVSSRMVTTGYSSAEISYEDVVGIVITTAVLSIVITSAVWVVFIHLARKNRRRAMRTPMSPIDCKSENSSHSSKDSGTGDSTKRSYQDLLLTTTNVNHGSIMGSHSESPSPVPESTLPLLTTFHPVAVDNSPYSKDTLSSKSKYNHSSTLTPMHHHSQNKQQMEHPSSIFCASPASMNGIQCACLTGTFKKSNAAADVCDCVVSHCGTLPPADHDVSCYGDVGKRPCSIPVPYHTAHPVSASTCCRHNHQNSYLCLYVPPAQHNVPQ